MILFTGTSSRPTIWGGCWISNHQPNRCAAYLNLNQLGRISTVFFLLMSVLHTRSPRWNFARHSSPTRGSCSLIDPQSFSSRTYISRIPVLPPRLHDQRHAFSRLFISHSCTMYSSAPRGSGLEVQGRLTEPFNRKNGVLFGSLLGLGALLLALMS